MVNFPKAFVDSLLLAGVISTDAETKGRFDSILRECEKGWPRRPVQKFGSYTEGQRNHHVALLLSTQRGDPYKAHLTLQVHLGPSAERLRASELQNLERELTGIQSILGSVGRLGLQANPHAHVDWRFPPDTRQTVIALPLLSISAPNMPFSDIVGVRFLKKTPEEGEVSAILELTRDRSLHVQISFPFRQPISYAAVEQAVEKGTQILGGFVSVKEPAKGSE